MSTTYLMHHVRTRFALFALALFIFLLVACGSPVSGSATTVPTAHSLASANVTTTPVPNSDLIAVLPELQKSPQAMPQVQTAHVDRQGKGTIQTSGALRPVFARQTRYKTQ
jgi:hypothetical protein